MKYKAIFFDRDGTLTCPDKNKKDWRNQLISDWSGHPFEEPSYDRMMALFELASEGRKPWYRDIDDERGFFRRYYRHLLEAEGVWEDLDRRAGLLFEGLWCKNYALFPETAEVLEYFSSHGYKMGVISDTSPSLQYTLELLGIAKYFTSFTASSLVGADKPSPIIFNAALNAQGVSAAESLYVDDYQPEADGAREQGFTSFLIDRSGASTGKWRIQNLWQLVDFVKQG
ncbi:MAG: HAD family hydrolase [Oscillospiraceae bacterium]|nr:HAD family hydrolase [Oscillospiraceae bacterium]